ncbi:MAG TPA: hypothetical protein DCY40_08755 [Actinobacteria bacterium]|nr:hypothetical protein [Actinomycetota bacterium]
MTVLAEFTEPPSAADLIDAVKEHEGAAAAWHSTTPATRHVALLRNAADVAAARPGFIYTPATVAGEDDTLLGLPILTMPVDSWKLRLMSAPEPPLATPPDIVSATEIVRRLAGDGSEQVFWQPSDGIALMIELEVYEALREFLADPPNPDTLLDAVWPNEPGRTGHDLEPTEGWGIKLFVDGRGRPDIVRHADFAKLLDEDLEEPLDTPELRAAFTTLADRMRATLAKLDAAIAEGELVEKDQAARCV